MSLWYKNCHLCCSSEQLKVEKYTKWLFRSLFELFIAVSQAESMLLHDQKRTLCPYFSLPFDKKSWPEAYIIT